jgi:hypothetical protein
MKLFEEYVKELISEGLSPILYHKTTIDAAVKILNSDEFMTSVAFGTEADRIQNKGKFYYFSTMRSPVGDYGTFPGVTFRLDGKSLQNKFKGFAMDYWGPEFRKMGKNEMEDRIVTNLPFIENASKYILDIHVGIGIDDKKHREWMISGVEHLSKEAMSRGIPLYVYPSEASYKILSKSKAMTFDDWINAFEGEIEPTDPAYLEYEKRYGNRKDSYLEELVALIKAVQARTTSKGIDISGLDTSSYSLYSKIKYNSWPKEIATGIKSSIHNNKSSPANRILIAYISKFMQMIGASSIEDLIIYLSEKI